MQRFGRLLGPLLVLVLPAAAQQHESTLTLDDALAHARRSAPAIIAARLRVEEARAQVAAAARLFSMNPTAGVEVGRRSGETTSTDYALEIEQELELPRRRRARVDAAEAVVRQEELRAAEVERETLRSVAATFLQALAARERVDAAAAARQIAGDALGIAERRYAAGDVALLDLNVARTAVARADAEARTASAELAGVLTELQTRLGIASPVTVDGTLAETAAIADAGLLARAAERPDLRLLDAGIAEAEAEQRLAQTLRWPDFALHASYASEERDRIVAGGVGVTLPFFDRGRSAAAAASARIARLRVERDALARNIEAEVRGALAAYHALRTAASESARTVLPLLAENEALALESYEAGEIGLTDLLLIRREALETRRSLIEQSIAARLAEVELRARTGVWP